MDIDLERKPELGQVWTPAGCALRMAQRILDSYNGQPSYTVLDPAVGPATFQQAFHQLLANASIPIRFCAYDTDERMCNYTRSFCDIHGMSIDIYNEDFILADIKEEYDAVIMNPPYIRHERIPIGTKRAYYARIEQAIGEKIGRRSNLYVLFLLKSMLHLRPGGIMCAIVYDAIMHSQYGVKTLRLLETFMEVLGNDTIQAPFGDAIIDARIICWKKRNNKKTTLLRQPTMPQSDNRVPLGKLLKTARGTALPYRKLFIAQPSDPFFAEATPFFMKQRNPSLFTCEDYELAYLNAGTELQKWLHARIAEFKYKDRPVCVKPITGAICFNYYLRGKPRHLLNEKGFAISDNYYVSTPYDDFPAKAAWLLLNSDLFISPIWACARNQGNGLLKLQAYEYRSALVPNWYNLSKDDIELLVSSANTLLLEGGTYEIIREKATKLALEVFNV